MPYYQPTTSLPVADTQTLVMGSADNTKLLRIEVDGFTTTTTRVLTPPNADATIAGINVAQTWTAQQRFADSLGVSFASEATSGLSLFSTGLLGITAVTNRILINNAAGTVVLGNTGVFGPGLSFNDNGTTRGALRGNSTTLEVGAGFTRVDFFCEFSLVVEDSGTNTVINVANLRRNTSGTAAAGIGGQIQFSVETSTTADQILGRLKFYRPVATHATRTGQLDFNIHDFGAERTALSLASTGSAPATGFLGASPIIRQTGGASTAGALYTGTEASMLQFMWDAMRGYGFLT